VIGDDADLFLEECNAYYVTSIVCVNITSGSTIVTVRGLEADVSNAVQTIIDDEHLRLPSFYLIIDSSYSYTPSSGSEAEASSNESSSFTHELLYIAAGAIVLIFLLCFCMGRSCGTSSKVVSKGESFEHDFISELAPGDVRDDGIYDLQKRTIQTSAEGGESLNHSDENLELTIINAYQNTKRDPMHNMEKVSSEGMNNIDSNELYPAEQMRKFDSDSLYPPQKFDSGDSSVCEYDFGGLTSQLYGRTTQTEGRIVDGSTQNIV